MNPFTQAVLAVASGAVLFIAGYQIGRDSKMISAPQFEMPSRITVNVEGIPSDTVECLDWVSTHFKDATALLLGNVCHGFASLPAVR